MKIEVVNAGKCMICGKPIKLAVPEGTDKFPNIFFCRECEVELAGYDLNESRRKEENNGSKNQH